MADMVDTIRAIVDEVLRPYINANSVIEVAGTTEVYKLKDYTIQLDYLDTYDTYELKIKVETSYPRGHKKHTLVIFMSFEPRELIDFTKTNQFDRLANKIKRQIEIAVKRLDDTPLTEVLFNK